jgi:hypothetical protein
MQVSGVALALARSHQRVICGVVRLIAPNMDIDDDDDDDDNDSCWTESEVRPYM